MVAFLSDGQFSPDLDGLAGYIGEFELVDDHRSGKIVIDLIGRINKCGVISPRFDVKISKIEQWTNSLLPSRQFGYIVMTTSLGIMDQEEVRLIFMLLSLDKTTRSSARCGLLMYAIRVEC